MSFASGLIGVTTSGKKFDYRVCVRDNERTAQHQIGFLSVQAG